MDQDHSFKIISIPDPVSLIQSKEDVLIGPTLDEQWDFPSDLRFHPMSEA